MTAEAGTEAHPFVAFKVPLSWCLTHRAPAPAGFEYCGIAHWSPIDCEMVPLYRVEAETL